MTLDAYRAEKAIAESYLDEMLEAERNRDFQAWRKRWQEHDLKGLDEKAFLSDLDAMDEELGSYKERVYFGVLNNQKRLSQDTHALMSLTLVWRMIYEKNEALTILGIRRRDEVWYPFKNVCHL